MACNSCKYLSGWKKSGPVFEQGCLGWSHQFSTNWATLGESIGLIPTTNL